MRIAIVGVGGVGGFFGAQLIRAGNEVALIARGDHLDAIRENGLTLSSPSGEMLVQPAAASDDPADIGPADLVILAVKAGQVTTAAGELGPLLGPETCVLPLQNGVEAAGQLEKVLGPEPVLVGTCGTMSWIAGPGHVRTLGEVNFIKLGEIDNRRTERVAGICQRLDASGIKAEVPDDIHVALWEKFLFVASLGAIGALHRVPFGPLREDPESRRLLELAMVEIYSLGRAMGVKLDQSLVRRTMSFVDELPEDGTTSLQRDLAAGRPSELETWSGAVVRLAPGAGIDVPVHRFAYESLSGAAENVPDARRLS